jgi:hypothetical protein
MNKYRLMAGILLVSVAAASAQVKVEILQDQEQFLPGESVPVGVRITNRSGRKIYLGEPADWLTFSMETAEAKSVGKYEDVPVAGAFTLESSEIATKRVNVGPYFAIEEPGRYMVTATVLIPGFETPFVSAPKAFDVVEGAKVWEQEFGVPPSAASTNSLPEVRKYILKQAHYIRGQIRLYLSVVDATGRTLRVFPIGTVLSFNRPDPRVDTLSNLHLLYQSGPRSFSYTAYNPNGDLIARQVYDIADSRPQLAASGDGQVFIRGGARRYTTNDIPEVRFVYPPALTNAPATSAPPSQVPSLKR